MDDGLGWWSWWGEDIERCLRADDFFGGGWVEG